MSDTMIAESTSVEFGEERFKVNAKLYAQHKRVIDAIASGISKPKDGYDSFDDAIAQVSAVWSALRDQVAEGGHYTPPVSQGFGSSNAAQVASALTGDRASVTEIRKSFAQLGK